MGKEEETVGMGWLGGTDECLEMSCSFDLLLSPVVSTGSTSLQFASAAFCSSGLLTQISSSTVLLSMFALLFVTLLSI